MDNQLLNLIKQSVNQQSTYKPVLYRLNNPAQRLEFEKLLQNFPNLFVFDELLGQVEEFVKSSHPKKVFKKEELTQAAKSHIGEVLWEEYGVWVYYPWSNRLVHILDEEEFVTVRTNRNQYKITPEEKEILSKKKIGVIGLSVGQSIALTLAMERVFGELRLIDFDKLELSNLNRIRAGVHNLEVSKVVLVAREIAEIDPFLKTTCYPEGMSENNMDDFFLKGGKLDVCIEVCDGLGVKIQSRYKARELGIPVVMNSSDKGTTDIERYDLNPNLSIMHGLIDHLDLSKVKEAKTNEEKVPYLLPMLGIETASQRLKASMLEIEQTITTWPQLASGVVLGGAIVTDVCRRILLNQFHESGRYFVDLEEMIRDKDDHKYVEQPLKISPSITDAEMLELIQAAKIPENKEQVSPDRGTLIELINAASLAPSGANAQSWKFMFHHKCLYLFFDDIFRPDLLDCKRTTMITGLGACMENLVLKAHELNLEVASETFEIKDDTKLISVLKFFPKKPSENIKGLEPHVCDELAKTIPVRISNRNICPEVVKIEKKRLDHLKKIARTIPGADLIIIDDKEKLAELADITGKMDRIRYLSKGGHNDFRGEARWTIEEALKTRNGISFRETMDLTPTEFAGFYVSKDWPVVSHLADWNLGSGFYKIQRKWVNSASALGLITMPKFSTHDFFQGGRALERVWLAANQDQISTHPPSLSTLIFNTLVYGPENALPPAMRSEALTLLRRFEDVFSVDPEKGKILLMRFFIGAPPKYKALRYPNEQILSFSPSDKV
jgi:hypothetical protein